MTEKLQEALDAYEKNFNDGFPMFQMSSEPPESIVEIIDKCIKQKKDVYALGYLLEDAIY